MSKSSQTSLFDSFESVGSGTTIGIVKSFQIKATDEDSPGLRKLKKNFNYRIKAIAELKEKIEKMPAVFATLNKKYDEIVLHSEKMLFANKLAFVEQLDQQFQKKSFSQHEREAMREIIMTELNEISEMGYQYDEKYQQYFQFDSMMQSEEAMEFMHEYVRDYLGVDVDMADLIGEGKLSQEAFYNKYGKEMHEHQQAFEQEQKAWRRGKGGSKSDISKDEQEINLHFMKTYKALAKKVHPDLEQNINIRRQKEALMQELAHAKDTNDFYALIVIKLKIERLESEEIVIDENYLKQYAARLLEQKDALELDLYEMQNLGGKNAWLYKNFNAKHDKTVRKRMEAYQSELAEQVIAYENWAELITTVKDTKLFLKNSEPDEDDLSATISHFL